MRAISLWEPWASAMANGYKQIETRSWHTSYRGDLLICAAQKIVNMDALGLPKEIRFLPLHHGCALCVVDLYACVPADSIENLSPLEDTLGYYDYGRYAFLTRNLRRLKTPVPWRGKQGLWPLTDDEIFRVKAQL